MAKDTVKTLRKELDELKQDFDKFFEGSIAKLGKEVTELKAQLDSYTQDDLDLEYMQPDTIDEFELYKALAGRAEFDEALDILNQLNDWYDYTIATGDEVEQLNDIIRDQHQVIDMFNRNSDGEIYIENQYLPYPEPVMGPLTPIGSTD